MKKDELIYLRRIVNSSHCDRELKKSAKKKIEQYLGTVSDALVRQALALYLIRGYTWQRVAMEMGWMDESTPRRLCERELKK